MGIRGHGLRHSMRSLQPVADALLAPATLLAALEMRLVREARIERRPWHRKLLGAVGVFPILDHYYEPLFRTEGLNAYPDTPRELPGVNLELDRSVEFLRAMRWQKELDAFPRTGARPGVYAFDNGNFGPGDAEVLYSMIRMKKPRRVIEIGSGYSTLVAGAALRANELENGSRAEHTCVEPFEMPWLERAGPTVLRKRVEELDPALFDTLEPNDILFIDSSHVIRPRGDVLWLFQRVVPRLPPGTLVHVHDIFTPFDYPARWLVDKACFWNEQYLLESFLAFNTSFRVTCALHGAYRLHRDVVATGCPVLAENAANEPKSFWMERV